jgi:uncharacterized protein (DUF2336 family)
MRTNSMAETLAQADVERLLANPSEETRAELAAKVGTAFVGDLTAGERRLAEEIFRVLVRDAAERVRRALAHHVKEAVDLPHDVALTLARDVETVALPMLENSAVLTDEDLVAIVHSGNGAKQVAIASRKTVSASVADALVDTANSAAVARLVGNDGAELSESSLQKIVTDHGQDVAVQEPLALRRQLPPTVLERLIALASDSLHSFLARRNDLPAGTASDLVLRIREQATAQVLSAMTPPGDAVTLARQLHRAGRLTASLLLRTLCLGDLAFLEAAFAELAGISVHNARLLIHDAGGIGLDRLYQRTALPGELLPAFRVAIDVARDTPFDGGENDFERHSRRTLERILTQFEAVGADNLDYLIAKLQSSHAPVAA